MVKKAANGKMHHGIFSVLIQNAFLGLSFSGTTYLVVSVVIIDCSDLTKFMLRAEE